MQSIIPTVNPEKSNRAIEAELGWSSPDACPVLLNPKLIKESGQDSIQDQHANKRPKHGIRCSKLVHEPLLYVPSQQAAMRGPLSLKPHDVPTRPSRSHVHLKRDFIWDA